MAAVIDAVAEAFPGAKVTYVKIGTEEFGQPEPVSLTVGLDQIAGRLLADPPPKRR